MKLERHENEKLNEIIDNYQHLHNTIEIKQKELKLLEIELNILLADLKNARDEEIQFSKYLEVTYGKGSFNKNTLEYEVDKK